MTGYVTAPCYIPYVTGMSRGCVTDLPGEEWQREERPLVHRVCNGYVTGVCHARRPPVGTPVMLQTHPCLRNAHSRIRPRWQLNVGGNGERGLRSAGRIRMTEFFADVARRRRREPKWGGGGEGGGGRGGRRGEGVGRAAGRGGATMEALTTYTPGDVAAHRPQMRREWEWRWE